MGEKGKNPERSLTEACVLRSKNIVHLKAALLLNRQTQFFVNRTPPLLPSQGCLKELEKELLNRIDEFKMDISKYLKQIFAMNKKSIIYTFYAEDKFCFSSKELQDGYVFFYKNSYSNHIVGVLILGEYKGTTDSKIKIEPGMVFEFNEIKSYLTQIESATKKNVSLTHAIRKIKQNESKSDQKRNDSSS